jgi:purine-binding chemotaxis protein CheW
MPSETTGIERILALRRQADAEAHAPDEAMCKLVIFELDGERFAFRAEQVREILPLRPVFFVPGCPPWLEGVINVRGDIESVINLYALLGKGAPDSDAPGSILLGRAAAMDSGVRVGRVLDVLDVPAGDIAAPPAALPEPLARGVAGVLAHHGDAVLLLDLEPMFADYARALA